MEIAQQMLSSFARIVRSDGGALVLLAADEKAIRLGYAPGTDEECTTGACVLPHLELQEMVREWLSRRAPDMTVSIRLITKEEAGAAG